MTLFADDTPMCKRCGHAIKDHSAGLDCRVCKEECGLDASHWYRAAGRALGSPEAPTVHECRFEFAGFCSCGRRSLGSPEAPK